MNKTDNSLAENGSPACMTNAATAIPVIMGKVANRVKSPAMIKMLHPISANKISMSETWLPNPTGSGNASFKFS